MSDELLAKEKKFRELNGEVERQTKELMKEVNSVANGEIVSDALTVYDEHLLRTLNRNRNSASIDHISDKFSKFTLAKRVRNSRIASSTIDEDFAGNSTVSRTKEETVTDDDDNREAIIRPTGNDGSANDAMLRFFKSKSSILETELETIKLEYRKKCDYSNELAAENKNINDEKTKLCSQIGSLKTAVSKLEGLNTAQSIDLQKYELENTAMKKEIDSLTRSLKASDQQSSNYNARLNRSLEDNDRLRKAMKCCKLEEKELREENRKLEWDKNAAMNLFQKQRTELLNAFRKQSLLVDNLKKQKVHLEADMHLKYAEEELLKLLDWELD